MTAFIIRPLPWVEEEAGVWVADAGQLGAFSVERDKGRWEWVRFTAGGTDRGHLTTKYDTAEAAKAAAENHYEEHVKAFLTPLRYEVEATADDPIVLDAREPGA